MEEKRPSIAPSALSDAANSPTSEPAASTRRRGGAQKRKSSALGSASNSSSTTPSSKRVTRDKPSSLHTPPLHHNGPFTRARQIPTSAAAATSSSTPDGSASAPAAVKHSERGGQALGGDSVAVIAEELRKESERQSLEASIEAEFEAIRSRENDAHVVPTHCGWFSWTDIHPIEKRMMPSFFNGISGNRTPDIYMEIRNWILRKFHANPNIQIELKDLSELNVGDLDARQEVMKFLDYWGLINFHPFPSMDSAVASVGDDEEVEKNALLEKLYQFENLQLCPPVVQKRSPMAPAMTSGLFPESAMPEELVKQEGPAVEMLEYHCNSCSADCSRKRYHCQKQADFDLCTDCFSNRRFGSGMSSSDFILMEPAEVAGVSGGKWTDQETLLLLEALELYKENWNEIAEHVGTKSKAQCILHFVQMPIEDAFVDRDDVVEASCKEAAEPAAINNDASAQKDTSEYIENNTSDSIENHGEASKSEDAKEKVNEETPKPEDGNGEKNTEETSKSKDVDKAELSQEVVNDCALNALKEAFAAVGYSPGSQGPCSFAEVGNPVMALAAFLARLVGSDVAFASVHSSLKSISGNSHGTELAARNCFILEDHPDNKEQTTSERDSKKEGDRDEINAKQDNSNMEIENTGLEDKRQKSSTDRGYSEKTNTSKKQAVVNNEECRLDNGNDPSNSKLPNDQALTALPDSGGSNRKTKSPPTSEELREGTLTKEPCHSVEETKDPHAPDSSVTGKNDNHQAVISNSNTSGHNPQQVEATDNTKMVSDSMPSDKSKPQNLSTCSVPESRQTKDSVMDVDMALSSLSSEKSEAQPLGASISVQQNGTENDVVMVPPLHPIKSNAGDENGTDTGKEHTENGTKAKDDSMKTKHNDDNSEKEKRAAVTTLVAAAVKAKILAKQEEEQIRQLTSSLIEKQLHKLETKMDFFNDMENIVMRVKENLERSRHKLFHERALIIASRLGLPASSSRGVPPSLPTNRIPLNSANSFPRSQIMMNPQRPPIPRPVGPMATTLPNPLASATTTRNSVQPSNQEKLSSVGMK